MIRDGYDWSNHKPYTIYLLNVDRGTVVVREYELRGRIRRDTMDTIEYPIESETFKTKEDAHNYAKEHGLKEDEYEDLLFGP